MTKELKFLVTGTGRCGTTYMARLLTSVGIMCGHEAIFNPEGIKAAEEKIYEKEPIYTSNVSIKNIINNEEYESWFDPTQVIAESSYMAAPFLESQILKSTKFIHLVRNPLDVMNSHLLDAGFFDYNHLTEWIIFVLKIFPELKKIKSRKERACYFYVYWNKLIEKSKTTHDYFLHKIEDGNTPKLFQFLGVTNTENAFCDNKMNSWRENRGDKNPMTLNDIPNGTLKKELIKIGIQYGYFVTML